ncbi:MAG: cytochrome P450 [Pseudomonadota bacterium]
MTKAANLPFLDLASTAFSTRGPEVVAARDAHWCARTPFGLAVLRHREVGQLLRDRRLRQGSYAWPEKTGLQGSFAEFWKRSVISQEGETHRQLRALALPALAPEFVTALTPRFDEIAEDLASGLCNATPVEFMEQFSIPFAGQAIAILLGMAPGEWREISHDASDLGLAMGVDCKRHEDRLNAACDRLMALADRLIAKARKGVDQDSFIARLVRQFEGMGDLSEQALRDMVVISIFGGVDTTRSQLGFAMVLFAEHQDQWRLMRRDPGLIPIALEEVIRAWPTTTWSTREATCDFEFNGQRIPAGETLHLLVHASARDPAVTGQPGFDITAKRHIHFGFGGGAHTCLGQLVARTDMAAAMRALSRQIESFEIAEPPVFLPDSGNTSPVSLMLRCHPGDPEGRAS